MGWLQTLRSMLPWHGKRTSDSAFSGTFGNGSGAGFAGGSVSRLTASLATWSGAVNLDLDASLTILRARGRQLAANNEHGKRYLTLCASNIVGPVGPMLQVRARMASQMTDGVAPLDKAANDAVEIHWARWCKAADITGRMDFAHLCRTTVKSVARDGEALVRIVRQPKLAYGIALQLLEADRLDETYNATLPGGGVIRQGIELDTAGRPIAYYIKTTHPGERFGGSRYELERVPAENIRHVFLPERAEQVRGYTWFHAIILRQHQLHQFNEAAVIAARIGASKVAALQRAEGPDLVPTLADSTSDPNHPASGITQISVEAGEILDLPPGYTLNSWNPEYPHANFESFVKAANRGIAAGVDVAAHNLTGDMTDVNYSSARIAELAERELWLSLQSWFIRSLVEPVFQEWLAIALLRGDITFEQSGKKLPAEKLSKFRDAARFQGRRWRWVDPQKEITAAKEAVDLGITSRTRLAAEQGEELADIIDELLQEQDQMAKLRPAAPTPTPAPTPAPADPSRSVTVVTDEAEHLRQQVAILQRQLLDARSQAPVVSEEPPVHVHIHKPERQPEIRIDVHPTPVQVINQVPEPQIVVEAHITTEREAMPAPVVNVTVQPADVTVVDNHPAVAIQTVERDDNDEITRTVTQFVKAP